MIWSGCQMKSSLKQYTVFHTEPLTITGAPEACKICSQFPTLLLTNADFNSWLYIENYTKTGYSIQVLVASQSKGTVANG